MQDFASTWSQLGLPTSEQAACMCSIAMPPHINLRKWETIWLRRRSRFCLTLSTTLTLHLWFFVISFVDGVHGRNAVHAMPGSSKRGQFTVGASFSVLEVHQDMDPNADAMYRIWRRVFWRTEINSIRCMCNLNEIKTKWQTLLIHPRNCPCTVSRNEY